MNRVRQPLSMGDLLHHSLGQHLPYHFMRSFILFACWVGIETRGEHLEQVCTVKADSVLSWPILLQRRPNQDLLRPVIYTVKATIRLLEPSEAYPGNDLSNIRKRRLLIHFEVPIVACLGCATEASAWHESEQWRL